MFKNGIYWDKFKSNLITLKRDFRIKTKWSANNLIKQMGEINTWIGKGILLITKITNLTKIIRVKKLAYEVRWFFIKFWA